MDETLFCSHAEPLEGFNIVFWHALALVFWHALAVGVHEPQIDLRVGVALLGETPQFHKFLVFRGNIFGTGGEQAQGKSW